MEPTQMQNPNAQVEMTPDEAKASLGIATRLSEQFFNPKQEMQPEVEEKKSLRDEYPEDDEKLDTVLEEIKSIKEELASLTEEEDGETE